MALGKTSTKAIIFNLLIVTAAGLLSRLLGVLRTAVFAYKFGTGDALAAYNASFRVIDIIYQMVIGGALASVMLPVFSRFMVTGREKTGWKLVSTVLTYGAMIASLVALALFLLAPVIVHVILPGSSPHVQQMAIPIMRSLLPQPIFLGLAAVLAAVLNSFSLFTLTSLSLLVYNASIIIGTLLFSTPTNISGTAGSVVVGSFLYFGLLVVGIFRTGYRYRPSFSLHAEGLHDVGQHLVPRISAQVLFQLTLICISSMASFGGSKAITTLQYSYALYLLPLGVIGIGPALVIFPHLSQLFHSKENALFARALTQALSITFFFGGFVAVLLGVLGREVIFILYQRGEFSASDARAVYILLIWYLVSLPFTCMTEILTRAFYACQSFFRPLEILFFTLPATLLAAWALMPVLHTEGLVVSFSFFNILQTAFLVAVLWRWRRKGALLPRALTLRLTKSAVSLLIFLALFFTLHYEGQRFFPGTSSLTRAIIELVVYSGIGFLLMGGLAYLFRLEEYSIIVRSLMRRILPWMRHRGEGGQL